VAILDIITFQCDIRFVEELDHAILISLEDFFTLPALTRNQILQARQQRQHNNNTQQSNATHPCKQSPDYAKWVEDYVSRASGAHEMINGRKVFLPLGVSELRALARLLSVEFQIMSKESVMRYTNAVILEEVDPRTIPRQYLHVFGSCTSHSKAEIRHQRAGREEGKIGSYHDGKRVVRLLNIEENHYRVHLPQRRDGSLQRFEREQHKDKKIRQQPKLRANEFGDISYWSANTHDDLDLPDL